MGKIEKSSGSISVIGGSDGPTSVFIAGRSKKTFKQRLQKQFFQLRKKWCALWIKPGAHTMEAVVAYAKNTYGFEELSKDDKEYIEQYEELRTSFIMMHRPKLLREYAAAPKLKSHDEAGIMEFQKQLELRRQKAKEISEDTFSIDFHVLKKKDKKGTMNLYLEGRFGSISGGWSSRGKRSGREFKRIYKDIYRYFGVTEEDIARKTERYQDLVRTLA
ncbi:MAG: hypothetical protein IJZ82_03985 [Lachnospiraceae bacterium]|nr:hypothetical protein [Lachnospiraceae bacterium]